jgi:hypothetical protein
MSEQTTQQETSTALVKSTPQKPEKLIVRDESQLANLLDTARFEHCYRIATAMSKASLIPEHLKSGGEAQSAANCFLVVNQALRWGFDPFAVAPSTYSIGGKLGYEGKLIAAVVNASGKLVGPLQYEHAGKGDDMEVTVTGTLKGEDKPRTVKVKVRDARTNNKMWNTDPEQKLCYNGAIKWARRHAPELVMGVMSEDDADRIEHAKTVKETSEPAARTVIAEVEVMPASDAEAAKPGLKLEA